MSPLQVTLLAVGLLVVVLFILGSVDWARDRRWPRSGHRPLKGMRP
jgi:hypothetical protein